MENMNTNVETTSLKQGLYEKIVLNYLKTLLAEN